VTRVAADNAETLEAWNGVLFDQFLHYRELISAALGPHGDEAIRTCPPKAGDGVLDIGCGFGSTTRRLAELVGPEGRVLGIDVAPRFIDAARAEAAAAGVANARFDAGDVQVVDFGETFDYAFARFGTMFFAAPVAALRNVRRALAPGGRLCMVVWRQRTDNPWMYRAEQAVKPLVVETEETDEPGAAPGPFSMANADTTSQILLDAGFVDVAFRRTDRPLRIGRDLDEAVQFNMALGPAAEVLRQLPGPEADAIRPKIEALLRAALAELETPGGVVAASSSWIVSARIAAA
jgi:ubiquinone/menaquinone biosynthesis C-methylase UbiE